MKFELLAETDDYIAVNKPAGLLSIPDRHDPGQPSMINLLKKKYNEIFVVHRLDKPTSGVMLFAKNAPAHKYFSMLFENRKIRKEYTGIVVGKMTEMSGTIDAPIEENKFRKGEMIVAKRGKPAVTHFEVVQDFSMYCVVLFKPVTGRTHQIRVHAKYMHHPLVGDALYGDGAPVLLSSFKRKFHLSKNELEERPLLDRLALHASAITFNDMQGSETRIEATLPKDMRAVIRQLEKSVSTAGRQR